MTAYGAYLERHHPGYKLIDMAPIAKHYFSEIGVRLSTRLHDEPAECAAAKVARMKCDSPPAPPAEERAGGGIGGSAELAAAELGITMIEGCGGCGQVTAAAKARGVTVLKGAESDPTPRAVWRLRFGEDAELDHGALSALTWRGLTPER